MTSRRYANHAFDDCKVWLCQLFLVGLLGLLGCAAPSQPPDPKPLLSPLADGPLADRAPDFTYRNGLSGKLYFPEIVGGGGALMDVDNDGDLDLYLVQGQNLEAPAETWYDRLFRNDGGGSRWTDITGSAGLGNTTGYGMGVAAGDIDNDGWTDFYVTNFGSNQLWRNNGGEGSQTFTDITAISGVDDPRWSTSAAFVDVDHDGWLDLYVVNYVDFRLSNHEQCVNEAGRPDYCGPRSYRPETDRLFRNLGLDKDGVVGFEDISESAGLLEAPGPGLGVVTADFNGDGLIDLYVANDQARNHLWLNKGDLRFQESALASGSAMDSQGRVQASMGIDAADVDGDGDTDLFMTHLLREVNTLYLNDGKGLFVDRSSATGLGSPSIGYTGFGAAFLDVENDGDPDVLVVNGEVRLIDQQLEAGIPFALRQPNQLFLNQDPQGPTFIDASSQVPVLAEPWVSRSVIVGDLDNDGDADAIVTNNESPVQILFNRVGQDAFWIGFRLQDVHGRDALGATITLQNGDSSQHSEQHKQVRTDGGYLSARDPRALFGLGNTEPEAVQVQVLWPSQRCELWEGLAAGSYHVLTEGEGKPCAITSSY